MRLGPRAHPKGSRATSLPRSVCFPGFVLLRKADGARAVSGGDRGLLVGEKHAVLHIAALGDCPQRCPAIEPAVELAAPVSAQGAGGPALVRFPVRFHQGVGACSLGHGYQGVVEGQAKRVADARSHCGHPVANAIAGDRTTNLMCSALTRSFPSHLLCTSSSRPYVHEGHVHQRIGHSCESQSPWRFASMRCEKVMFLPPILICNTPLTRSASACNCAVPVVPLEPSQTRG
jgi:hypothetical protein